MARVPILEIFQQRHALRLVVAGVVGRLPTGMVGLALVLYVHARTGSFAAAGSVSAAFGICAGLVAPLQGRLVDRLGQSKVLFPTAALDALFLSAIVFAGEREATVPVLVALAALAGCVRPPLAASARSVWPSVLPKGRVLESVYALEGVLVEVIYIVGPLLVAGLAALESPGVALLAAAGLSLVGTFWFATAEPSRLWRGEDRAEASWAGPLAGKGIRVLLLTGLAVGLAFGMLEVGVPAFSDANGKAASAGISFSAMAAGSMVAGLWYGTREWQMSVARRYALFLWLFALGFVPLSLATSTTVMVVLMGIAGLALAPAVASGYMLIAEAAPRGTLAEAYSWAATANTGGTALGAAAGGLLVENVGFRSALQVAGVMVAVGAAVALGGRKILEPVEAA